MAVLFIGSLRKHWDVKEKKLTDFHRLNHQAPFGEHSHGTQISSHSTHSERAVDLLMYMQARWLDCLVHNKHSLSILLHYCYCFWFSNLIPSQSLTIWSDSKWFDQFPWPGHLLDKETDQMHGSWVLPPRRISLPLLPIMETPKWGC